MEALPDPRAGSGVEGRSTLDSHSYANPRERRVTHLELDLTVDFDQRVLRGTARLHLAGSGTRLVLDTRDLTIESVRAGDGGQEADAPFSLGPRDPVLGAPLTCTVPPDADHVTIGYRTSPDASGLQWLEPAQTAGGRLPFLFSQAEAIHARSFVPCQDSPGVRITFAAVLRTPPGVTALMAAENHSRPEEPGVFRFGMPLAIPPYLIALAVGELAFEETGPRTGVWAEPGLVAAAASEFADAERMIAVTEELFGPYRWGRFDVLVLPPAFPFGGMENPCLTFATPTVIAGDHSLVSLIAHELAHSWSGNLVTNADWSHFWLNEGFTTYIERRIVEALYGRDRAEMEWLLGRHDLEDTLTELAAEPGRTALVIDLTGRDPDDGITPVAYEKGAHFLRLLEETFGRAPFDALLRNWFDTYAFTSRTTDDFVTFLDDRLLRDDSDSADGLNIADWLHGPGLPTNAPLARSDAFGRVEQVAAAWAEGTITAADVPLRAWATHETLHFLRSLPVDLPVARLGELDAAFALTDTGNAEIVNQWLLVAIRAEYAPAQDRLWEFLIGVGRRKFLKPLYTELMKTPAGRDIALSVYEEARPRYHHIARVTIDAITGRPS